MSNIIIKLIFFFIVIQIANSIPYIELKNEYQTNGAIKLHLSEVTNLLFNDKNKWQFDIKYLNSSKYINEAIKYNISILYNEKPSLASCINHKNNSILNCLVEREKQNEYDKVKVDIYDLLSNKWANVTNNLRILEQIGLTYITSYNLTYKSSYWYFKIQILETLAEKEVVTIDIFKDNTKDIASCTYSNSFLNCSVKGYSSNLIKISSQKESGTVFWKNLNQNASIPFYTSMTYTSAFDLELYDNKWNFTLQGSASTSPPKNSLLTINIIIKNNVKEEHKIANCFSNTSIYYKCEFECENPDKNSLVYISTLKEGVSITWSSTTLKYEGQIIRYASLHFLKVYDLIMSPTSKKWEFKIDIEDELPNKMLLSCDVIYGDTSKANAYCQNNNKVLNCTFENTSKDKLVRLSSKLYRGSISWINLNADEVKIPLTLTMTFSNAYALIFAGKWNFIVDAINVDTVPVYSLAKIDIIHNSVETTAICEIMGGSAKATSNITCVSELEEQSETDSIKLNFNKKYGTIQWSKDLSEEQETIKLPENKAISLTFIHAYELTFLNNKWIFMIQAKSTKVEKIGGTYILEILYFSNYKQKDSTATCLLTEGIKDRNKFIFKCVSNEQSQNENDSVKIKYPQTSLSTLTWTAGIVSNYDIVLSTSLTLVRAYNLELSSQIWGFNIEVKDGTLPPGSKVIVDIYRGDTADIANCTASSNILLSCFTAKSSLSSVIRLTDKKSAKSSVIWKKNLEKDYRIYLNTLLELRSAKNLCFNETDNKWHFILNVANGYINSKVKVSILYEYELSTATCIHNSSVVLNCIADKENQKKNHLVFLSSKEKAEEATVTWKYTNFKEIITLERELTFSKADNLRYSPKDDKTWIFDIHILDEDVPNDSEIEVEVSVLNLNSAMNINTQYLYYSTALCTHYDKVLSCEVTNTRYQGYSYTISLKTTKKEGSTSSVTKWNNVDKESIPITLVITLEYNYCTDVRLENGKHIFYCNTHSNSIPVTSESYVGISIDGKETTSLCLGFEQTVLKCEINEEEYTSPNIYLLKDNIENSTVTWKYLYKDQYLYPIKLDFFHAYDGKKGSQAEYTSRYLFKILAHGKKLKDKIKTGVQIYQIGNGKLPGNQGREYFSMTVGCEQAYGILFCYWYHIGYGINPELDEFYLTLNEKGNQIEWSNPGKKYIQEKDFPFTLNYNKLNYITFNNEKKCFQFSFIGSGDYNSDSKLILDLFVSGGVSHAFCIPKENNEIFCYSEVNYLYKPEHTLKIRTERELGNVIWNNTSQDFYILNANDYIFIEVSKIFDLKFDSNIWKFKIKPKTNINFSGSKTFGVLIGGKDILANCIINNGVLECSINSAGQDKTQLVKLNKINDYKGQIQIMNFENEGIPFNINLEFVNAYDLEYDYMDNEEWSFRINVKNIYNTYIPIGSTFSVDISYDNNNDELAFCTQEGESQNNIITLLCKPQNKVEINSLIKINKNKSLYSSITWTNSDFDEDIIINAKLNVLYLDNLVYDEVNKKSKFYMHICYPDLAVNSKVLIDLNYNDLEKTGTCKILWRHIFECYPNVENQREVDIFEVSPVKKLGTVTYLNKLDKLKFLAKETDAIIEKVPETDEIITEKITEKPTEKITEAVTEQITEKPTEKITEAVTEQITEKPTEQITEAVTEQITEKPTEQITEAVTEQITEKPTEQITEAVTEQITEKPTEQITEKIIEIPIEQITEKIIEKPTEQITEKITENIIPTVKVEPTVAPENLIPTFKFEKAYDLKFNKKWRFKIKVSESNLYNGNSVTINTKIDDEHDAIAVCIIEDYILSCELMYSGQSLYNDIQIINNKKNENLKWINLPDVLDLYMSYEIKLINIYGGFYNNKWRFNILHEPKNQIQKIYDKYVLLDILVNNLPSTALCEITDNNYLKCVSNHKNQNKNDYIIIEGNINPNLGTVYLDRNLDYNEKKINPVYLSINYESSIGYKNKNKFEFAIYGYLKEEILYEIGDETITKLEINRKNNSIKKEIIT